MVPPLVIITESRSHTGFANIYSTKNVRKTFENVCPVKSCTTKQWKTESGRFEQGHEAACIDRSARPHRDNNKLYILKTTMIVGAAK